MNQAENEALRLALENRTFLDGLNRFLSEQKAFYTERIVLEARKSQPDNIKAAQDAGRLDAYSTLLAELAHYVNKFSGTHPDE